MLEHMDLDHGEKLTTPLSALPHPVLNGLSLFVSKMRVVARDPYKRSNLGLLSLLHFEGFRTG
jgi:hypothetical protein